MRQWVTWQSCLSSVAHSDQHRESSPALQLPSALWSCLTHNFHALIHQFSSALLMMLMLLCIHWKQRVNTILYCKSVVMLPPSGWSHRLWVIFIQFLFNWNISKLSFYYKLAHFCLYQGYMSTFVVIYNNQICCFSPSRRKGGGRLTCLVRPSSSSWCGPLLLRVWSTCWGKPRREVAYLHEVSCRRHAAVKPQRSTSARCYRLTLNNESWEDIRHSLPMQGGGGDLCAWCLCGDKCTCL